MRVRGKMMRGMERAMFFKEDTTFNDIRDKSLQQWLDEMEQHQDVAVRGGVKLTREYVQYLKDEIGRLRHENEVKNAYLKKLQAKYSECTGAFCGFGVAVKDFKNPVIDFDRNNTYIQSEGINQDFGVYDSPDELLKEHHQEMSRVKAFLYRNWGRHMMNRNVRKIRGK